MRWHNWILLSLLAAPLAVSAQETAGGMVANPSFEMAGSNGDMDAEGWREQPNHNNLQQRSQAMARTGQWSLRSEDNGSLGGTTPNTTQTIVISSDMAGKTCRFWAWAAADKDKPLTDGSAMLKIEFLDAAGAAAGKAVDRRFLDKNQPAGQWVRGELSGVIPANTRTVKIQLMHHWGGKDSGGVLYFDDAGFDVDGAAAPAAGGPATAASPTAASPAPTTLLSNADFEAAGTPGDNAAAGWNLPSQPVRDCMTRSSVAARGGKWSLRSVDDGSNSNAFPNASQVVKLDAAAEGKKFRLRAWTMTPADQPLADGSAMLKVEFNTETGDKVGKAVDTAILRAGQTPGQWVVGELTGEIPAGTRRVKVQLMHNWGGQNKGGTLYFDDAAFEVLP